MKPTNTLSIVSSKTKSHGHFAWPMFTAAVCATAMSASAQSALNTFDSGPGTWTSASLTTSAGYNLGWSNTHFAGGNAGEVGGLISRTSSATGQPGMPYVLDTVSFGGGHSLSLNSALAVSGLVYLNDVSAGSDINFGYYSINDPGNQRAVLRFVAPGTAGSGVWRFRFGLNGSSGTRVSAPDNSWNATSLSFNFLWTPSGLNDGSGTLSGSIANGANVLTIPSEALGANSDVFDSFGLWVDSAGSTDLTKKEYAYLDNVRYTVQAVPEPGSVSLAALGGLFVAGMIRLRGKRA